MNIFLLEEISLYNKENSSTYNVDEISKLLKTSEGIDQIKNVEYKEEIIFDNINLKKIRMRYELVNQ